MDQVVTKFDSVSAGAFLVKYVGVGVAGWRPYIGSFASIFPRIMPSKPVPGSIDGTYSGHPSRLVPIINGNVSAASNIGVSPAAISIWQFGYRGLIPLILGNIVYLYLANSRLLAPSLVSRSLGFFMLGMPAMTTVFSSPDVQIMILERVLVVYIMLSIVTTVSNRRRLVQTDTRQIAGMPAVHSRDR